ncbi:MAG: hypothetical protein HY013_14535 [Candidatus Solibacter usitatus]|nr:hypothetical protein [Candidatus Solibacter usitatus]
MTRRARLTLSSVLLAALLAGSLSALYLRGQINKQFQIVLERSEVLIQLAADAVVRSIDNQLSLPVREALIGDVDLADRLLKIMTTSRNLLEIAICDPRGLVLTSTDPTRRRGEPFPDSYGDYRRLAGEAGVWERVRVLRAESKPSYYQLSQVLEDEGEGAVVSLRVVVYPGLIRRDLLPDLNQAILLSLLSVLGAAIGALLFSSYAFKPLGQVSQMLDHLMRGEYTPQRQMASQDEFGAVFSKVDLLGQQLGNFERVLDQLEEAVLIFGRDRNLVVASGALETFLGRRRAQLSGSSMGAVFPPESPLGALLDQVAEAGKALGNVRVPLPPGGKLSHALLSVEILETAASSSARNAGLLVRLRDPEAHRQIQGQLQTAERLSAINRVTSGVAHEVKNPLNAILMHVELAKMKLARGDSQIQPQMEIISKEILRLDRVVKTFLDFTRPTELKLAEVLVDAFVIGIADLARPQAAGAGIEVQVDTHAEDAAIAADPDLLKLAVLNLVLNAIEAMPAGGTLRFESRTWDQEAEIRVVDTGAGIAPELREKIFQLYFTTKPSGSGIGLAMTFRIVQLHGGKIEFLSEPDKGTTFYLRFPVTGSPL